MRYPSTIMKDSVYRTATIVEAIYQIGEKLRIHHFETTEKTMQNVLTCTPEWDALGRLPDNSESIFMTTSPLSCTIRGGDPLPHTIITSYGKYRLSGHYINEATVEKYNTMRAALEEMFGLTFLYEQSVAKEASYPQFPHFMGEALFFNRDLQGTALPPVSKNDLLPDHLKDGFPTLDKLESLARQLNYTAITLQVSEKIAQLETVFPEFTQPLPTLNDMEKQLLQNAFENFNRVQEACDIVLSGSEALPNASEEPAVNFNQWLATQAHKLDEIIEQQLRDTMGTQLQELNSQQLANAEQKAKEGDRVSQAILRLHTELSSSEIAVC